MFSVSHLGAVSRAYFTNHNTTIHTNPRVNPRLFWPHPFTRLKGTCLNTAGCSFGMTRAYPTSVSCLITSITLTLLSHKNTVKHILKESKIEQKL